MSRAGGLFRRVPHPPRGVWGHAWVVIAACLFDASSALGQAAPPLTTWSLDVAADSQCANDPEFVAELVRQIPQAQRAATSDAELVAKVRVAREKGGGLIGEIRVRDRVLNTEAGARRLELPKGDCAHTAEALGLVLAVLVEAGRGAPPPPDAEPASEGEPAKEPRDGEEVVEPSSAARPPAPPGERPSPTVKRYAWLGPRAGHDLQVGVGGGYGLSPGAYGGGVLAWGLRVYKVWPVWLSFSATLPRATIDGRAEFMAYYGSVYPCPLAHEKGRLRGRLCVGFSAGALRAKGQEFESARSTNQALALVGIETSGDLALWGPWTLFARVRPEVPLLRERFVYYRADGVTPELHEPKPVTVSAYLGTGLRFR